MRGRRLLALHRHKDANRAEEDIHTNNLPKERRLPMRGLMGFVPDAGAVSLATCTR